LQKKELLEIDSSLSLFHFNFFVPIAQFIAISPFVGMWPKHLLAPLFELSWSDHYPPLNPLNLLLLFVFCSRGVNAQNEQAIDRSIHGQRKEGKGVVRF
jgi:hypothetical protein